VAYHFHWSHREVMSLEHAERRRWVEEISSINRRLSHDRDGSAGESERVRDFRSDR
jgi:hypothetical protein